PDVRELENPAKLRWKGMSERYCKQSQLNFQEALKIYRAAWKKGLTNPDIDDDAIASSIGEQYDHGYWLKEKIFRLVDKRLLDDKEKRERLHRAYFMHEINRPCELIDSLDANEHK